MFLLLNAALFKGVLVAFEGQKQGFQRRLNEVLETARTYVFQFWDN